MKNEPSYKMIDGIKCYHPEIAEDYSGYPAEGFNVTDAAEKSSFWVQSRHRILSTLIGQLITDKGEVKFLEIGCGSGSFLNALSTQYKNIKTTGSEIYPRGFEVTRRECPNTEFIQLDATRIPFKNEFDVIGAFDVIEHIDQDSDVLAGVANALKINGALILSVPQYDFLWSAMDDFVHHKRRYNKRDLAMKIEKANLKIIYMSSFVFTLFPLMLASRVYSNLNTSKINAQEFNTIVKFNPFINSILSACMRIDEWLIKKRVSLPWGGSLIAIAIKK